MIGRPHTLGTLAIPCCDPILDHEASSLVRIFKLGDKTFKVGNSTSPTWRISFMVVTSSCRDCENCTDPVYWLCVPKMNQRANFQGFIDVWVFFFFFSVSALSCFILKTCTIPLVWWSNKAITGHLNSSKIQFLIRFQLLEKPHMATGKNYYSLVLHQTSWNWWMFISRTYVFHRL